MLPKRALGGKLDHVGSQLTELFAILSFIILLMCTTSRTVTVEKTPGQTHHPPGHYYHGGYRPQEKARVFIRMIAFYAKYIALVGVTIF